MPGPLDFATHISQPHSAARERVPADDSLGYIKNNRSARRNVLAVAVSLLVVFISVFLMWPHSWTAMQSCGLALLVPSILLWGAARIQLHAAFTARVEARSLVTHGLYRYFQNPIYLFGGLSVAGIILFLRHPLFLLFFLVLAPLQWVRIRREEAALEASFGDAYRAYRDRTWF